MPDLRSTRTILAICVVLWIVIVARAMLNTKGPEAFVTTVPASEVQAFAKEQLAALQQRSFAEDQELCAVIFEDSAGELSITPLISGEKASCDIAYFDEPGMAPVASLHTHGAFDDNYDSEVPSLLDMRSDIESGTDGYISTPGGRFWRIDSAARSAKKVCGEGCLAQDPAYKACDNYAPVESYTLKELNQRFVQDKGIC